MAAPILRLFDSLGVEVTAPIAIGEATPGVPTAEIALSVRNNDGGAAAVDAATGVFLVGTARVAGSGDSFLSLGNAFGDAQAFQARVVSFSGGAEGQVTGFKPSPLRLGNIPDGGIVTIGIRVVATALSATSDWEVALGLENNPQIPLRDVPFETEGNYVYQGLAGGHTPDPDFNAIRTVQGAFAAQAVPSDTIDLPSLVRYHLAGEPLTYRPAPRTLTFNNLDSAAAALLAGEYYWAGLTLDSTGSLTTTKGLKATTPTDTADRPTLPADEVGAVWVVVPFGLAIDTVLIEYELGFFHAEELGGLNLRIHPGSGAAAGFWAHPETPLDVTLTDDASTTVWALPSNTYELATTGTIPTVSRRALRLWDFTTASGAVTDRRDRRILGPMATISERLQILYGDDYRVVGNHREIQVRGFNVSVGTGAYVQLQPVSGTMDPGYDPRTPRYQVPDAGSQFDLQVASTSASDDGSPLGTGAGQVRTDHIDATGAAVTTETVLNGQTAVSIDATALALNAGQVIETGSGGAQVGILYFGTGVFTAGVPAQIYTAIFPVGHGSAPAGAFPVARTLHGAYMVPLLHTAAVAGIEVTAQDAVAVQVAVMRPEVAATDGPIEWLGPWRTSQQLALRFDSPITDPVPAQSWIWIEAITEGAVAGPVSVRLSIVLQEETS